YVTDRGATYNSYLVQDEKVALIDTVKRPFAKNLLGNLKALLGDRALDYVVINHAEPDHAGSLAPVLSVYPNATVICTKKCKTILEAYNERTEGWNFQLVASGDSLSLGARSLTFLETPMVHWPESMFSYMPEEKLLFSMDAFGQHFASTNRFDNEVDMCEVMQ
ncbi:MAG: oxygen-binding di-iron domain-containing protein, partial [Planctomycetota bacterium]